MLFSVTGAPETTALAGSTTDPTNELETVWPNKLAQLSANANKKYVCLFKLSP
jgi:hypothetical protein